MLFKKRGISQPKRGKAENEEGVRNLLGWRRGEGEEGDLLLGEVEPDVERNWGLKKRVLNKKNKLICGPTVLGRKLGIFSPLVI